MTAPPPSGRTGPVSFRDTGFFAFHGPWAPGVRLFRRLRFASKAVILTLAFMPLVVLLAWQAFEAGGDAVRARREALRQQVELAHGAISALHDAHRRGELPAADARALARATVAGMRHGAHGHVWIADETRTMRLHPPDPALEGRALGEILDADGGTPLRRSAEAVAREGAGFVEYRWRGPGADAPAEVVAYAKAFEPWGWTVGSSTPVDDLHAAAARGWLRLALVAAAVAVLAAYLFASFFKVLDGGLRETRRHLRALTDGDLTTAPRPWGRDEAAQLMHDVRAMQDAIRSIVVDVRAASDAIVVASGELASGATDLSGRTDEAATRLEQTASSMVRISDTVAESAEHAAEAAAIAGENSAAAGDAGRIMGRVVSTMDEIGLASGKIREIVGTIDGIAFQTNILALNAAVEAARAGESGRGFAVVAAEVRVLAQRSAQAARQVKTLIGDSVRKAETGTEVVREAGEVIDRVVANASRLGQLIGQIADGAREQALGVGQVGHAVSDLDRATQQNARLVEQAAMAIASLRERADGLSERVGRFRIADAPAQRDPPPGARRRARPGQ